MGKVKMSRSGLFVMIDTLRDLDLLTQYEYPNVVRRINKQDY